MALDSCPRRKALRFSTYTILDGSELTCQNSELAGYMPIYIYKHNISMIKSCGLLPLYRISQRL